MLEVMTTPQNKSSDEEAETMGSASIEYRMPPPLRLGEGTDPLPEWVKFKQQFQIFLTAAGFDRFAETRKAAIFLNSVGHEAQELYFNVLKKEDTTKYEQIVKLFDEYFAPKQNEVINAYNFNKRKQGEGENFDFFYTEVRKFIKNCNYKEQEDRMLRDRIVLGIEDKTLQRRLLEISDLTLQKAVDVCRASELSRDQCRVMQRQPTMVDVVRSSKVPNKYQQQKDTHSRAKYYSNDRDFYSCKKCGMRHGPRNCPAFGKICSNCHKPNHFKRGCKFIKEISLANEETNSDHNNHVHDL